MKRIALVLAAAFLGTGCVSSSDTTDYGSVNLYWSFARTAPAAPGGFIYYDDTFAGPGTGPCLDSSVEEVTVDSPLGQTTVACVYAGVQGIGLDDIAEGARSFRFRGWRGAYLVYDTVVNLDVIGNATTDHYVELQGVSQPLDMFAYLSYGAGAGTLYASCAAAIPAGSTSPPNIGYEIRDVHGALVDDGFVGCSDPLPAAVFVGDLELDNFDVRMRGYRVEDDALVFDSCAVRLDHFVSETGVDGFAPVLRTNPIPTCP